MAVKPGPKPKIGEKERAEVLGAVGVGASIGDAAGLIGVSRKTLQNAMRADSQFYAGVMRAKKDGKVRLIRKVATANAWQAAAWMLERMYGAEFGRKDTLNVKGQQTHIHQVRQDVAALAKDPEAQRAVEVFSRRMNAISLGNSNGHPTPKDNGSPNSN